MNPPPDLVHYLLGTYGTATEILAAALRSGVVTSMADLSRACLVAAQQLQAARGSAQQVDALERLGHMTSGAYHG